MGLQHLFSRLESRLINWLGDVEVQPVVSERVLLREEIKKQQDERDRFEDQRHELLNTIEQLTETVALYPSQIEASLARGKSSQAMRQSYELERMRRDLEEKRSRLARLEQAIWSLNFRLRRLRREMGRLDSPSKPT